MNTSNRGPEREVLKNHDNGVSTWYLVELSCGHSQKINWTIRKGWKVPCYDCLRAERGED